jgi:hypothetical protein
MQLAGALKSPFDHFLYKNGPATSQLIQLASANFLFLTPSKSMAFVFIE